MNKRIYAKIMRYLERITGTGFWDFRTLHMTHPQLAIALHKILIAEGMHFLAKCSADEGIQRHYVPRRIWNIMDMLGGK